MAVHELRDPDEARRFLAQGLWLQRATPPRAAPAARGLEWAHELAATGEPLPPVGVVADVGHVAFGLDREGHAGRESVTVAGLPAGLIRAYEDLVLGKLYA